MQGSTQAEETDERREAVTAISDSLRSASSVLAADANFHSSVGVRIGAPSRDSASTSSDEMEPGPPAIKRLRTGTADTGPYTPQNILVTGGAGFIASHLVILLTKKYPQYKVVNFDKLDYCSSLRNLSELDGKPNYKFVRGNLLSPT